MPVMVRGEMPAQQQPHSTSGYECQVRFNTLSEERDHPTDRMSTNAEDSDEGDKERLQTGPLLGLGRSARPMGRGRPFDDDERSLLPLFRLTDDVNRASRGCSRGANADKTNQQKKDNVRRSVSSVSDRYVRTLLNSRNQHDDVRPTEHGARHHPDAARHSRQTQLRLFDSEEEGRRLQLSTPTSYMEPSSRPIKRETADRSTTPIRRLFVGAQPEYNRRRASRRPEEADVRPRRSRRSSPVQRRSDADDYDSSRRRPFDDSDDRRSSVVHRRSSIVTRTQIPSCKWRRNTTPSSSAMVEYYDSDCDEDRTLKPSSTYRSKRRVTYR